MITPFKNHDSGEKSEDLFYPLLIPAQRKKGKTLFGAINCENWALERPINVVFKAVTHFMGRQNERLATVSENDGDNNVGFKLPSFLGDETMEFLTTDWLVNASFSFTKEKFKGVALD